MFAPFKLNATLGRSYNANLDDTRRTKQALARLGHYETPDYGIDEYPDESLFHGIEKFQEQHGLQRDGIMKPDGETATKLGEVLAENEGKAAVADVRTSSLLTPVLKLGAQRQESPKQGSTSKIDRPALFQSPLQSISLLVNPERAISDVAHTEPNPDATTEKSKNEGAKQAAVAIAPAIPLIGEIPSAVTAILGMLGLSGLLKRDTPEESERERICREQLEDDTRICDEVWRKHGDAATAKCRASAMERYANCLAGRPAQPLYKGTD